MDQSDCLYQWCQQDLAGEWLVAQTRLLSVSTRVTGRWILRRPFNMVISRADRFVTDTPSTSTYAGTICGPLGGVRIPENCAVPFGYSSAQWFNQTKVRQPSGRGCRFPGTCVESGHLCFAVKRKRLLSGFPGKFTDFNSASSFVLLGRVNRGFESRPPIRPWTMDHWSRGELRVARSDFMGAP